MVCVKYKFAGVAPTSASAAEKMAPRKTGIREKQGTKKRSYKAKEKQRAVRTLMRLADDYFRTILSRTVASSRQRSWQREFLYPCIYLALAYLKPLPELGLKSIRVHLDPGSKLVCVLTQTLIVVTTVRIICRAKALHKRRLATIVANLRVALLRAP